MLGRLALDLRVSLPHELTACIGDGGIEKFRESTKLRHADSPVRLLGLRELENARFEHAVLALRCRSVHRA
jgi:hypothetical protein